MALRDYLLLPSEEVIASCPSPKKRKGLHATNNRIILYHKGLLTEDFHDLSYSEITAVTFRRTLNPALLKLGLPLLIAGIGLIVARLFFEVELLAPLGGGLIALEAVLLILSLVFRRNFCQLKGSGVLSREKEEKRWQLGWWSIRANNRETQAFVRAVREHLPAPVREA